MSKVVRVLQLKVTYVGSGLGTGTVTDEQIRIIPTGNNQSQSGLLPLRVGQTVQVKHPEKKDYVNATINRIRDCSQYTVGKCFSFNSCSKLCPKIVENYFRSVINIYLMS